MRERKPVTAEEIVGIGRPKNPQVLGREPRPSAGIAKKFKDRFKHNEQGAIETIYDPGRLFRALLFDGGYVDREYWSFTEGRYFGVPDRENMNLGEFLAVNDWPSDGLSFSLAHRLKIAADGTFKVFHHDVAIHGRGPSTMFHTESGLRFWDQPDNGERFLVFKRTFNDQYMEVCWNKEGKLSLVFSRSLTRAYDNWMIVSEGSNFYLRGEAFSFESSRGHRLTKAEIVDLQARDVAIVIGQDRLGLDFYRRGYDGILDYSIEVPRNQRMVTTYDRNSEPQQRFAWEQDLIPEGLRKTPFIPPSDFDDIWMRADLEKLLGIEVKKNNPEPSMTTSWSG